MSNPEAGRRFEKCVRIALVQSERLESLADLFRATGLHPNTLYDLFNGVTNEPEPKTIAALAEALDVSRADLWAAWEGRELEPDSVKEALRRHTSAMDRQNRLLGELVTYIRSSAVAIIAAGGDKEQILGATIAIDAAREDQAAGQEGDQPIEPAASFRRRKSDEETPPQSLRPENGR